MRTAGCPVCGTTNGGKKSCCGKGGAWQGKCGSAGDSQFDHTWYEGVETCMGVIGGGVRRTQIAKVRQGDTRTDGTSPKIYDEVTYFAGFLLTSSALFV